MNRLAAFILCAVLSIAVTLPAKATDTYAFDKEGRHYYAGFQISHLGFSVMHGRFDEVDALNMTLPTRQPARSMSPFKPDP